MTFATFGLVEWLAFVVAVIGIIKIVILAVNKKVWLSGVSMPVLNSKASPWVFGILALILLYYLLPVFGIVQLFAVIALTSLLMGFSLMIFAGDLKKMVAGVMKKRFSVAGWIYMIVWFALSVWVLMELF